MLSGFAPSKLFETEVDEDRVKERLAALRKAAVFDTDEKTHKRALGMWTRFEPQEAIAACVEGLVKVVKEEENGLDLAPVLAKCPDEVRDAIFDWWSEYPLPDVAPPDGVLDEMIITAARTAAGRTHNEFGSNPERLLDYPQFFLEWVGWLIAQLVNELTENGKPSEVYIQVPNTDIPLETDVPVILSWGFARGYERRSSFRFDIPWFGRHVVKRDWMAYARVLAVTIYRDVPEEFDDEEE